MILKIFLCAVCAFEKSYIFRWGAGSHIIEKKIMHGMRVWKVTFYIEVHVPIILKKYRARSMRVWKSCIFRSGACSHNIIEKKYCVRYARLKKVTSFIHVKVVRLDVFFVFELRGALPTMSAKVKAEVLRIQRPCNKLFSLKQILLVERFTRMWAILFVIMIFSGFFCLFS